MADRKIVTRLALARRLQSMALALAADRPIRSGGVSVRVPNRAKIKEEIETTRGETELEIEIAWTSRAAQHERGRRSVAPRTRRLTR